MTPKFGKFLEIHFHWILNRVDEGQFRVMFVPSVQTLAEFFTKSLPVGWHITMSRQQSLIPQTHYVSTLAGKYLWEC
jgi:hypothetical protein